MFFFFPQSFSYYDITAAISCFELLFFPLQFSSIYDNRQNCLEIFFPQGF